MDSEMGNLNGHRARDALGDEEVQRGLREYPRLSIIFTFSSSSLLLSILELSDTQVYAP